LKRLRPVTRALKWRLWRFLGRRGYHVIPDRQRLEGSLGLHLRKLFEKCAIDCVVDVGANRGQYRDFLRNVVGYTGPIASFEPDADLIRPLQARARRDRAWRVYGYALGARPGASPFNIMQDKHFSSFLQPDHGAVTSFTQMNRVVETRTVEVTTLDDMYPVLQRELACRSPYLKLDTQGYDLEVLKGGGAVLPHFSALQTEASVKPIYENMPDYKRTIETLEASGFELSGMFSVSDECFPSLIEFDCVMVNRRWGRASARSG
jgi:FkbM family methyltransferase